MPQRPLTVFIHVPKTAGTTFTAILRENFPDGANLRVLEEGFPFGRRHELVSDARYVTFLRDPVERMLEEYHGLREHAGETPLPGDGSLEAALAAGLLFDNLQTRMLSNAADPLGPLGERALEEAKDNLRSELAGFGIAERFDESVVLLAHVLGLERMLVEDEAVAGRPRAGGAPEHDASTARLANRYDDELYRWAVELFEQRVSEQGGNYFVDLAALRMARDEDDVPPPPGSALEDVWRRAVETRLASLRDSGAEATVDGAGVLQDALDDARTELDRLEARAAQDHALTEEEAERLRSDTAKAQRHFQKMQKRVSQTHAKLAGQVAVAAEHEKLELKPEVFEKRSAFFDAASPFTEFVCARLGSARLLVKTQDRHIGRAIFLKHTRGDIKHMHACIEMLQALLGEDAVAGRVLIDVGANIGSTTVHALIDGPFGHAVAVEPDPDNFEVLQLNLLLNGVEDRATAIRAAASSTAGELPLAVNPVRGGRHRVATGAAGLRPKKKDTAIAVPAVTLDSLAAEGVYDPAEVGLLWIDAEHHEAHILAGASKLIEGGAPVVFEWDPVGLDREGENRERIGAALGDHYTHFVDTKLTDEPGATFRLRPIAELASHVHSGQAGGAAHSTDVLVLRLAPDQVPAPDVLDALVPASRGKTAIVEDDAAGDGVVEGD